jgi:hypothetical protein
MPADEEQYRFPDFALVGHHRRGHHNRKAAKPARVPSATLPCSPLLGAERPTKMG